MLVAVTETQPASDQPTGKGRPTPKRRDAQKRRRGPVPTDKKEAAAQRRAQARESRQLQRQALLSGDERHLPARDAGPARRLARDLVDSRFSIGQIFFVLVLVALLTSFVRDRNVAALLNLLLLVVFVGAMGDAVRVGRKARHIVAERF